MGFLGGILGGLTGGLLGGGGGGMDPSAMMQQQQQMMQQNMMFQMQMDAIKQHYDTLSAIERSAHESITNMLQSVK
jgi:hypothetical protein